MEAHKYAKLIKLEKEDYKLECVYVGGTWLNDRI
jgi:hypothetical protein